MLTYIDIDDGYGWREISDFVADENFSITINNGNESFRFNQNTLNMTLKNLTEEHHGIVLGDLFFKQYYAAICGVAICGAAECGHDEDSYKYEVLIDDMKIRVIDDSDSSFMFTGHAPVLASRVYNGLIDLMPITIEATDYGDLLDAEVGDIVYRNYTIYDPVDTSTSIIHQLALIAGFTLADLDSTVTIADEIFVWAPPSSEDKIVNLVETLLYEYGYILTFNEEGLLKPTKWQYGLSDTPACYFTNDNIVDQLNVTENVITKDGINLTYYEAGLGTTKDGSDNLLLYRDGDLPYDDDGTFAGYIVFPGEYYPPEVNVIDDSTGLPMVVYQDYQTDSISYFTNKAIVNDLDYNYKAFDSDFSDIIATEDVWVDFRADAGLVLDSYEFFNKKARLVYRNTTGGNLNLYYSNIYGKVYYRTKERTVEVAVRNNGENLLDYTCVTPFIEAVNDIPERLAQYQAALLLLKDVSYSFKLEDKCDMGTLGLIDTNDGTFQRVVVSSRTYDGYTRQYTIKAKGVV